MASSNTRPIPLPDIERLSKHSRKFYDGTYQWDSDGFTDDKGVYRSFDCYDPLSRAPTPLPPLSLGDEEEDEVFRQQTKYGRAVAFESIIDTKTLTFAPDPKGNNSVMTVRCSELFRGHVDRERLIGKMEGVLIASRANKVDLTLEECYHLCGIPYPDEQTELAPHEDSIPIPSACVKHAATTSGGDDDGSLVTSPKGLNLKLHRSCSSSSSLSDCPSDISQWDVSTSTPVHASTGQTKAQQVPSQEAEQPKPKHKYSTRGVAQKVKRGAKK